MVVVALVVPVDLVDLEALVDLEVHSSQDTLVVPYLLVVPCNPVHLVVQLLLGILEVLELVEEEGMVEEEVVGMAVVEVVVEVVVVVDMASRKLLVEEPRTRTFSSHGDYGI